MGFRVYLFLLVLFLSLRRKKDMVEDVADFWLRDKNKKVKELIQRVFIAVVPKSIFYATVTWTSCWFFDVPLRSFATLFSFVLGLFLYIPWFLSVVPWACFSGSWLSFGAVIAIHFVAFCYVESKLLDDSEASNASNVGAQPQDVDPMCIQLSIVLGLSAFGPLGIVLGPLLVSIALRGHNVLLPSASSNDIAQEGQEQEDQEQEYQEDQEQEDQEQEDQEHEDHAMLQRKTNRNSKAERKAKMKSSSKAKIKTKMNTTREEVDDRDVDVETQEKNQDEWKEATSPRRSSRLEKKAMRRSTPE
jgi:outer membrane biosynthesis protein TonB